VSAALRAAFYFDLASPLAYFAAERVLHVMPVAATWRPVLAGALGDPGGRLSPRESRGAGAGKSGAAAGEDLGAARCAQEEEIRREELARRAAELGLQLLRLPAEFPFDSDLAMRVATYAASIGRAVPFAQAAFRQAFAGGRSLADPDSVLIAAAACEMHPSAVLKGAELRSTRAQLQGETRAAAAAGVREVPTVAVGGELFVGERALEAAARRAQELTTAGQPAG
jgi:2-hydroxychromene-2-carboxylate isomerase